MGLRSRRVCTHNSFECVSQLFSALSRALDHIPNAFALAQDIELEKNALHKLCGPREESFSVPLKYIDVTRTTFTSLDVLLGKQIDDYWMEGERELSDAWTGFTRFILLYERLLDGHTWSWRRLTRKQNKLETPHFMARYVEAFVLCIKTQSETKVGPSRNQSSIMPDRSVVSCSLNQMVKNQNSP